MNVLAPTPFCSQNLTIKITYFFPIFQIFFNPPARTLLAKVFTAVILLVYVLMRMCICMYIGLIMTKNLLTYDVY